MIAQKERFILAEKAKVGALFDEARRDMDNKRHALNECEKGEEYREYLRFKAFMELPLQG
jgi:hypothetical protein